MVCVTDASHCSFLCYFGTIYTYLANLLTFVTEIDYGAAYLCLLSFKELKVFYGG